MINFESGCLGGRRKGNFAQSSSGALCILPPQRGHWSREINEAVVLEEGEIGIEKSSWLFHQGKSVFDRS